jgi:hypothetical protein
MIVYNPNNERIILERIAQAGELLSQIPAKHCFITGSFLYKEKYRDIDVFVITRSKRKMAVKNPKVKINRMDFNSLYSLFYHSASKSCIAKNILPHRPLKVTIADYWRVINEAVPAILNEKNKHNKHIRDLMLYTEYFKTGSVMDTFQLSQRISHIKRCKEILQYIIKEIPVIICNKIKKSYAKRFFYTQAAHYKQLQEYKAQRYLYRLTHLIARGISTNGKS